MKNCDRGQFFTMRIGPKPANNLFIYLFIYLFISCFKLAYKWVYATLSLNCPGLRAVYDPS